MSAILPVYARCNLKFTHGIGAYLYEDSGEKYLDFAAGIGVNSFGHSHPHLVAEMQDQAAKLWHVSNLYGVHGLIKLTDRLAAHSFAEKIFFCNSGAEAVECAIKMVRKYHSSNGQPKHRIITFDGSFHGRTLATISAAKKDKVMAGFEPAMDGFDMAKFGDIDSVKDAITSQTGGILIEPIIGEGGVIPASKEFMQELRALADENNLLLVLDEVQCGMGRTGKLFAHQWLDVNPDIVASAKGIGGGFPLGACLATDEASKGMTAGTHGSTYGNNPMAMRVGNAVMDLMLADGFFDSVQKISDYLWSKISTLQSKYPDAIIDVRGKGLMIGIKIDANKLGFDSRAAVEKLRTEYLLTVAAADNIIRLLPPLNITEIEVDEAMDKLEKIF